MTDFVEIARVADIPPGTAKVVRVADVDIALFHVDGRIYAIADACIHAGASLASGRIRGHVVTCRGHGLQFDITTGCLIDVPGMKIDSYPLEAIDGRVLIALDSFR
jgi:nitrite reductase/ring-hydroxylating ferredoxin subunit